VPFQSKRQQRYMFANPGKLGGMKKVMEWAHATDYSHLPERAPGAKVNRPRRRKKEPA